MEFVVFLITPFGCKVGFWLGLTFIIIIIIRGTCKKTKTNYINLIIALTDYFCKNGKK